MLMIMNKKRLIIATSIALALTFAIVLSVKLRTVDAPKYIPGSVTVTFKPEHRNRSTVETIVKSVGGTVDYNEGTPEDGWYEIHVKNGEEDEAERILNAKPEIEYAYRSIYARAG